MYDSKLCPENIKAAIDRHVATGCPTGDFVRAVLENNLKEAFMRADNFNAPLLGHIVAYCYNEIPSPCWGSKVMVQDWREKTKTAKEEVTK